MKLNGNINFFYLLYMKIKPWVPFPVCPSELAKELFPPLRKGWKRAKKSFLSKAWVHSPLPRNQKPWQEADFVRQFGVYLRLRWERLWAEDSGDSVVLCFFAVMKSLYLDRKGPLSVCAEHFSTNPRWLSPFSRLHLVRSCLLASQKELSGHFALVLCLSWFLWKASLFWVWWTLLNSFSVLQDEDLCQERYKGTLWSAGSPFLLARASVMHIFPLLVACTSLLHCLYHSNSGLTADECCTLWATRLGRTGYIWRESSQIIFLVEGFWPRKQFLGKKKIKKRLSFPMVRAPYECPISFCGLVATWSVWRRICHLQAREFIFPLPSVNGDVDSATSQVSKSITGSQDSQCCSSRLGGKPAAPREGHSQSHQH